MLDDATKQKLRAVGDDLKEAMQRDDDGNAEHFRAEIRAILGAAPDQLEQVWSAVFAHANGSTTAIDEL